MNTVENICAKIGCPAACCRDIRLNLSTGEAARFLEGQEIHQIDPQEYDSSDYENMPVVHNGINIVKNRENSDEVHIFIKGYCALLDLSSFNCTAYLEKRRPNICAELPIGHYTCVQQRNKMGLQPVSLSSARLMRI